MKRLSVIFMLIRQRKGLILFGIVAVLLPLTGCIPPLSPSPPSDLEVIPVSSQSIRLIWQDNAFTEDGYEVVRENGKWKITLSGDTEYLGDLLEEEETAYETEKETEEDLSSFWQDAPFFDFSTPDFYGERLTVPSPPEEAFELYLVEGEVFIIRYEQDGKEKVDSSILSRAYFDPDWMNVLVVWIVNDGRFPIELDYDTDRYYVESYGGKVYQCEIDLEFPYDTVINPGDSTMFSLIFPSSASDTDIKNIIIELAEGDIVIGLQKIPR